MVSATKAFEADLERARVRIANGIRSHSAMPLRHPHARMNHFTNLTEAIADLNRGFIEARHAAAKRLAA